MELVVPTSEGKKKPAEPMSPRRQSSSLAAEKAIAALTAPDGGFQKWLSSPESAAMLDKWNEMFLSSLSSSSETFDQIWRAHFESYKPPADCAGYLLGLAILAETLPLSLTIADASIAGFPLVYVNQKFTETTGYTKKDCQRRNCRFLQGPSTNSEHGEHMHSTLRDGQSSQTLMLNYRKSGEPFENLLTMAFIGDSLGRRRFCIGLQLDLTGMESDDGPWGKASLASGAGKELIKDARLKMSKLIKMFPKAIPVQEPPPLVPFAPTEAWSCPQLEALSATIGTSMPPTKELGWGAALCALLDHSAHAAVVVDMGVPMLPLLHVNAAFTSLTGYTKEDSLGKNCRFMQGPATEPQALNAMVRSLREHTLCSVRISNFKKDGSKFTNDLSLHPVFDSDGNCRYTIGVLADADAPVAPSFPIEKLREAMPTRLDAALQPIVSAYQLVPSDPLEQWKEMQPLTSKLMRLLYSTDPDGALRRMLTLPPRLSSTALASLGAFLHEKRPEDESRLLVLINTMEQGSCSVFEGRVDQPHSFHQRQAESFIEREVSVRHVLQLDDVKGHTELWDKLQAILESTGGAEEAAGAAGKHSLSCRMEAAKKLVGNRVNVLRDMTNPSDSLNIHGKPLTQTFSLIRVPEEGRTHADLFLIEVACRLLGNAPELEQPVNAAQSRTWTQCAKYLQGRIQSTPQQRPGRTPDLSVEATAAMLDVMDELRSIALKASIAAHQKSLG